MASYRDLIVWQKAHENFLEIIKLVDRLPQCRAAWEIARQIIRAAGSIGANIAEGHGRQLLRKRIADYRNFFEIALGSAAETDNWLQVIADSGWIAKDALAALQAKNVEIMKMLCALIERQAAAALPSTV